LATCLLVMAVLLVNSNNLVVAASSEEALRARVNACYAALQQGDWRKVEKYLTKESIPLFRGQTKKPLTGYEIGSIKIDPDGQTALVEVVIPVTSAIMPTPILMPQTHRWRMVRNVWYMELVRPSSSVQDSLLEMANKPMPSHAEVPLSKDLKFESGWASLGNVEPNTVAAAKFSFKNVSTHPVTLARIQLGCDCLRLKTQQKEYAPGEAGTLEIEFDPSSLRGSADAAFTQDIVITTEPGDGLIMLTIAARIVAAPAPPTTPP